VELLSRVDCAAPARVVDLGCGEGTSTAWLHTRWPGARVTGIDSSAEMLAAAARFAVPDSVEFVRGDVRGWEPDGPVDVVVSNAVLHWVLDHAALIPRWAGHLAAGGWLAVQVPGNFGAPTHALLAELCRAPRWADRLADAAPRPDDVWETTYLHVLRGEDPILEWVGGTVLRPVLGRLEDDDAAAVTAEYAAALRTAYPARPDGSTVLPFRRIFAVGQRR
jgi:trans-aconitate 2-methyltransferase